MDNSAGERASYLEARNPTGHCWRQLLPKKPRDILHLLDEKEECQKKFHRVFLRIKPSSDKTCMKTSLTFTVENETTLTADAPHDSVSSNSMRSIGRIIKHQYKFSKIFDSTVTQKQLFQETCLEPLECFVKGENCVLFAYGATGAGKTFTIQGNEQSPGIIPQSINIVFNALRGRLRHEPLYKPTSWTKVVELDKAELQEELKFKNVLLGHLANKGNDLIESPLITSLKHRVDFKSPSFQAMKSHLDEVILNISDVKDLEFSLWVSFYEVHNEIIYDLLDILDSSDSKRKPLSLHYINGSSCIKGLKYVYVSSPDEAYQIYMIGKNNLQMASTNVNAESSRSHCVFTVSIVRTQKECPEKVTVNNFSCIDLAGAERAKKTQNVGERMRESQNINTSLHVLSRCLAAIRDNQKTRTKIRVPFRDSKLTQILQFALTGDQSVTMIINVNLDPEMYNETVNVLKFSAIAREIVIEQPRVIQNSSISSMGIKNDETISCSFSHSDIQNHSDEFNKLKRLLSIEREKNKNLQAELELKHRELRDLDAQLRADLTDNFSSMLQRNEDRWERNLKAAVESNENIARIREKELLMQQEELKNENRELSEEVYVAQAAIASLKKANSDLKKEIAELRLQLKQQSNIEELNRACLLGDENLIINSLKNQLKAAQEESMVKDAKIQSLIFKLEEAKEDFILLEKSRERVSDVDITDESFIASENSSDTDGDVIVLDDSE